MSDPTRSQHPKDAGDTELKITSPPAPPDPPGESVLVVRAADDPDPSHVTPARSVHRTKPKLPEVFRTGLEHSDTNSTLNTRALVTPLANAQLTIPPPFMNLDARGAELIGHLYGGGVRPGEPWKEGKPVTDKQIHGIIRQAYENVLVYGLETPALAADLHQNISNALGRWVKRQVEPSKNLKNHIFFETQMVQRWNADRLGEGVRHDSAVVVPDKNSYFPLRWAALEVGVEVQEQQAAFELAAREHWQAHTDKPPASSMPTVQRSHRPKLSRSSIAQPHHPTSSMAPMIPGAGPKVSAPGTVTSRPPQTPTSTTAQPHTSLRMAQNNTITPGANQKKRKRGSNSHGYDLLGLAPSTNIPFPASGKRANVTVVELLAFLPRYFKRPDIVDRFIANGGTQSIIRKILNEHRVMKGDGAVDDNYVYQAMKTNVRNRGGVYDTWTVGTHPIPEGHDPDNLNIAGLLTGPNEPSIKEYRPKQPDMSVNPIQFKSLGDRVKNFPSGFDALDLTACVRYAMNHPDQSWEYPKDFEQLVAEVGGPADVDREHYDRAAFRRWGPAHNRYRVFPGENKRTHEEFEDEEGYEEGDEEGDEKEDEYGDEDGDEEEEKLPVLLKKEQACGHGFKRARLDHQDDEIANQEAQSRGTSTTAQGRRSEVTRARGDSTTDDEIAELSEDEFYQNLSIKRARQAPVDKEGDQEA